MNKFGTSEEMLQLTPNCAIIRHKNIEAGALLSTAPGMAYTCIGGSAMPSIPLSDSPVNPSGPNPSGLCQCGCGQRTTLAAETNTRDGYVKGQPVRFLLEHHHPQRLRPLADRFWEKVDQSGGPAACWLWTDRYHRQGYGIFSPGHHRTIHAHRQAWILTHGPIPAGLFVCHNCPGGDNPACVNPAHMFLGTPKDNTQDAIRKGRARTRCLSAEQVLAIRAAYATEDISIATLAAQYSVNASSIANIIARRTWGWLLSPEAPL